MACIDTSYAARHGPYDGLLVSVVGIAVAAEDPYYVGILVSLGNETSVSLGVALVEDRAAVVPVAAPCGQQPDIHAQLVGAAHDIVHMVPIVVLLAILDCGARRVAIRQRQVAVGVGYIHAVKLGQSYGLYDVEALGGAVAQVEVGLLAVETVEKLPRRVPLIEERAAVGILQIVAVFGYGYGVLLFLCRGGQDACGCNGSCKH